MSLSIDQGGAVRLVSQAGETYDTETGRASRHMWIKRLAAGVGLAACAFLAVEGHSLPVNKAEHTITVVGLVAGGSAYLRERQQQLTAQNSATAALEQAVWYSDPGNVGGIAAPLQSWVIEALPAGESTDALAQRALAPSIEVE